MGKKQATTSTTVFALYVTTVTERTYVCLLRMSKASYRTLVRRALIMQMGLLEKCSQLYNGDQMLSRHPSSTILSLPPLPTHPLYEHIRNHQHLALCGSARITVQQTLTFRYPSLSIDSIRQTPFCLFDSVTNFQTELSIVVFVKYFTLSR